MASTLTWLHLSDLHMRRDELDNLRVVLKALWNDLPAQIDKLGGRLDFIAFTGDIAYSGKAEEYELAGENFFQPLLKTTGLSRAKLFIVPGNHDVDWRAIRYLKPDIPASLTNRAKVTEFLESDDRRRFLFAPMASYAQFVQHFFGGFPEHSILHDPLYSYVQLIKSGNQSIALIGLNSAWLSGFTRDAKGNATDRGNLLISDKQIGDALREARNATVRVAMMHHPFSWLKKFEDHDARARLSQGCDLVLRGHLHAPDFVGEKALGGQIVIVPAGTIYKSHAWLNGYNLIQLDLYAGMGKIVLRRYSEDRRKWVEDARSTGKELPGLVEFELIRPLDRPALALSSTVSQVLSEVRPYWLRLGRERETQLLETLLKQKEKNTLWIWGNEGCGLAKFLRIIRALLQHENADVIFFDAEDAAFGVAVDQHYFLEKLEQWADIVPMAFSGQTDEETETIEDRLKRSLAGVESRLMKSDRRLVLIFANLHLLNPTIREWVWRTLWGQVLESLEKHNVLAIFACEGPTPVCPASDQENKIYLPEFTVKDVERFLRTLPSVNPEEISDLAREIHSGGADEFLALPWRVYPNVIEVLGVSG